MTAILSLRNRSSTPSKLLVKSGPDNRTEFNETPLYEADESKTILILPGFLGWYMANIGKIIGSKGIRYLYSRISEKNFFAGSFSFLGQWPLKDDRLTHPDTSDMWVACGIGTPNYPVSTGVILWYGRMSLGIKLHPCICQDPKIVQACIEDWKAYLLMQEG